MGDKDSGPWTLGIWTTKEGREAEFQAAWREFASWTAANQPGAGEAFLLRDVANPRRFISFGPWSGAEAIAAWRQTEGFTTFVAVARELCEDFQPNTLRLVEHVTRE